MYSNYHPHPSNGAEGGTVASATVIAAQNIGGVDFLESNGSGALKVSVVSGGSSGTEYTEGDTDSSITGTAVMWEDAGDTLRAVSAAKPLPVAVISGSSASTEYTEGDTDTTFTGVIAMAEGPSNTATPLQVDASKHLQVDIAADSAGLATSAKQDTIIGHVDGIETLIGTTNTTLTTIDGRVDGIEALLTTIDADTSALAGTVSGSELQVDIVSMPTVAVNFEGDTADLDSGAGSDDHAVIALGVAASGGHAIITGDVTNGLDVDVTRSALPSGASTSANQTTIIGHLDGVEALLTTIDADTSNLSVVGGGTEAAAIRVTIANNSTGVLSVDDNGGALTVDGTVTAELGATDNAVLDAIAASVAAIDTDTTTIIGHVDGIEGLLTTIDADTGSILTSTQLIDDTIVTLGTDTYTEATSKGQVMGAVRRDADTTLVNTTNEFTPLQVDANGRLKVEAFSGETLPVSLTSTTITGTVAVTQSGTWDEVGINDSGNSITVDNATISVVGSGTEATAQRVTIATDSTGVLSVDDNGGNLSIDDGGNTITVDWAASTNTIEVVGDIAHDTAVGGNPVLTGAEARDTLGTAVATGDTVRLAANRYGAQHTTAYPTSHASSNGTPITATTTSVISAPAASSHLRVTRFTLSNGGTTATWVGIRDGAAGTQHYRMYLVQGSVVSINLNKTGPLDLTTATRLDLVLSAAGSVEYEIDYLTVAD